jgi:hypothetical protein
MTDALKANLEGREMSMHRFSCVFLLIVFGAAHVGRSSEQYLAPERVEVLPLFFVTTDGAPPTSIQANKLMRHVKWAQSHYREMLGGRDTFQIAEDAPAVYRSKRPLAFYRSQKRPAVASAHIALELFDHFKLNRWNCPYVFLVLFMNPRDRFPAPAARPINGGLNSGGAIVKLASRDLDQLPSFQKLLRHELGHGFGLVHVDTYGYDQKTNDSIMAYNEAHQTHGFRESRTPARLIPEDVRALALCDRIFPNLEFDPSRDIPAGYTIHPRVELVGPLPFPEDKALTVRVATASGETQRSQITNIVHKRILPSRADVGFNPNNMWHSGPAKEGWVSVTITFPLEVELTAICVHCQHSGKSHAARSLRIEAVQQAGLQPVIEAPLPDADSLVQFTPTKARQWQLHFQVGSSGKVVIRGLRFYQGDRELFPPVEPYSGLRD